jgi:hypothetical protein
MERISQFYERRKAELGQAGQVMQTQTTFEVVRELAARHPRAARHAMIVARYIYWREVRNVQRDPTDSSEA